MMPHNTGFGLILEMTVLEGGAGTLRRGPGMTVEVENKGLRYSFRLHSEAQRGISKMKIK